MKPQNLEEKVVWYSLIGTYGLYFLGAQYLVVPAIAWFLAIYLGKQLWDQRKETTSQKIIIPFGVWVWLISMLLMIVPIIISHLGFDLGTNRIIFSVINWARQYALFALFPLIGCLNIRPQLVYRAICIIALQSLCFMTISYLAICLDIPHYLYTSPLRVAGGGPLLYNVLLYISEGSEQYRMTLFAPWCPALGLVANVYFFLACQESNRIWRWIGMISSVAMIVVSVSRAALICLPADLILTWLLLNFSRPLVQLTAGLACFLTGIFAFQLMNLVATFQEYFVSVRPGSSKVRSILSDIALYRWWNEAPIWGHGIPDNPGPKLVERMPIGSHHTWVALLFTKGLVGFIILAVPLLCSFIDLLIKAQKSKTAKTGLSVVLVLFLFSFSETIETITYLYWPGLLIVGIAFKESVYVKKTVNYIEYNTSC